MQGRIRERRRDQNKVRNKHSPAIDQLAKELPQPRLYRVKPGTSDTQGLEPPTATPTMHTGRKLETKQSSHDSSWHSDNGMPALQAVVSPGEPHASSELLFLTKTHLVPL